MESIICVTCSAEVSMRHALKHMEKCFQKVGDISLLLLLLLLYTPNPTNTGKIVLKKGEKNGTFL
ncbi:unnamed protein product [Trichobilharzia regenti]|nr:unnamed protein product [Trichobilharzia regenti]